MNIFSNIISKTKDAADKAYITATEGKIIWVSTDKLILKPSIQSIFEQKETEISNISEDMKINGFNPANPLTISQHYEIAEGYTRYFAASRAGLNKVAVVVKHFDSEEEMLEYAYKQQLHRRNLSEQDVFSAYKKLRALTDKKGKKAKTDIQIAEELHISPRQVAKMKEIERKASPEIQEAFDKAEITLNQAYNQMKEELKPAETEKESVTVEEKAEEEKETVMVNGKPAIQQEAESEKPSGEVQAQKTELENTVSANIPRKAPADRKEFEKLSLKFKPEDFALVKTAAETAKISVTEYVMNLVMKSIHDDSDFYNK